MKKRSMVICEGETDQIILSYYFEKQFGYRYAGELGKILNANPQAEFVRSYVRAEDGDKVVIWAIGGKSLFADALKAVLEMNRSNADELYSKILILTDNDSEQEREQLWQKLKVRLQDFGIDAKISQEQWIDAEQKTAFDESVHLKLLGIAVPPDEDGALETFLLNALAEQENNRYLAKESKDFVKNLIANKDKIKPYLSKRGHRVKAPLAVFFAIASPERIFAELNPMLQLVQWEKYKEIQTGFKLLDEVFSYKDGV